jgi:predicted nucleic acid-binding protein
MTLVLADTSVWVAHFRRPDAVLQDLLSADRIVCHPLVLLEIACGTPPSPRQQTLGDLGKLRQAMTVLPQEALTLIDLHRLYDSGCGAVDILILASVLVGADTRLWTLDRNLASLAARLGVKFEPQSHSPAGDLPT